MIEKKSVFNFGILLQSGMEIFCGSRKKITGEGIFGYVKLQIRETFLTGRKIFFVFVVNRIYSIRVCKSIRISTGNYYSIHLKKLYSIFSMPARNKKLKNIFFFCRRSNKHDIKMKSQLKKIGFLPSNKEKKK